MSSTPLESLPVATNRPWLASASAAALVLVMLALAIGVPLSSAVLPASHPLFVDAFYVTLLGKILCYAIVALAMGLVWGYAGILSLGHGAFFALGGYAMGMYLMRSIGADGHYQSELPDFMVFLDWTSLPWHWAFSEYFVWCLMLAMFVPGLLAFVFGYFAFRSRIQGVYFSIITQALTYALMLLFFRNETGFGGNNGAVSHDCEIKVRSHLNGGSRRRRSLDVLRLQPIVVQAIGLDILGRPVRHCRRAVCATSGHHQSQRDVSGQFNRNCHLGGGRWSR